MRGLVNGLFICLAASVGVLIALSPWIWRRKDAPAYEQVEITFLIPVVLTWFAAVSAAYSPNQFFPPPVSLDEVSERKFILFEDYKFRLRMPRSSVISSP